MIFEPITLQRIEPTRNMARFYAIDIQPDLFGQHCLIRNWGRIGSLGRVTVQPFATAGDAATAGTRLAQLKQIRGYRSGSVEE